MRPVVVWACALVAALSTAAPARAETLNTPDELARSSLFMGYLRSGVRDRLVIESIAAGDRQRGEPCNQPYLVRMVSIAILRPVLIGPGSLAPDDGIWSEKLSAQRCGRSSIVNLMFIAGESPLPRPVELLPGMTAAGPPLMRDVLPMAMAGATGAASRQKPEARDCKQIRVTDTSSPTVVGDRRAEPNSTIGRVWFEIWTLDVCGIPAQVRVDFSENLVTKGTNFTVSLK